MIDHRIGQMIEKANTAKTSYDAEKFALAAVHVANAIMVAEETKKLEREMGHS